MLKRPFILIILIIFNLLNAKSQTLDYYIGKALENNPVLMDYQFQQKQAPLDSMSVKAIYKPQINSSAQAMYAPDYKNFGYDAAITNGGNYAAIASVSQDIFKGAEKKNKYEAIGLQTMSIRNTGKITKNDLIRQLSYAYVTALADNNELNFSHDFLKLMQEQAKILQELSRQGIYRQTDYLTFLLEVQGQEVNIKKIQQKFKDDVHLLNQLCGISDTVGIALSPPDIIRLMPVDPQSSPLFMQFTIDSLRLINQKITVDNRYRPNLNWFADAGMMSSTPSNMYRHFGYSLGLNFSIPIYDGSLRKLDKQKISLQEDARASYANFFRKKYNDQLRQADDRLQMNAEMTESIRRQSVSAENLISIYREQLNQGNISVTELINAMKTYINIKKEMNQAEIDRFMILADWNYLMQKQ